jgi:hypothetical protein
MLEAVLGAALMDSKEGGGAGLAVVWRVFCGIACSAGMEDILYRE